MEYKRTHSNSTEAFPKHCDYGCSVEVYKAKSTGWAFFWWIVVVALSSLMVYFWVNQ